jgi:hypothetical protein
MRAREQPGMRQLMRGNRLAAAAVAHEVQQLLRARLRVAIISRPLPSLRGPGLHRSLRI